MKLKTIINIFGGPGVGKSTVAAGLFSLMKKEGYNVEFVTEYAKELTYEGRYNVLEQDQLYIFAKQHRKILRLKYEVDYIISDSPLLLSVVYSELNPYNIHDHELFKKLVYDINSKYHNLNIFLKRNGKHEYKQEGRYQDKEGAMFVDKAIESVLSKQNDKITFINYDDKTVLQIFKLLEEMNNEEGN